MFWDPAIDYFGIAQPPGPDTRGRCFMFWNLARFNPDAPLLAALVSGAAAREAEGAPSEELAAHAVQVRQLRTRLAAARAGAGPCAVPVPARTDLPLVATSHPAH